jgi:hypothetical protein
VLPADQLNMPVHWEQQRVIAVYRCGLNFDLRTEMIVTEYNVTKDYCVDAEIELIRVARRQLEPVSHRVQVSADFFGIMAAQEPTSLKCTSGRRFGHS